MASQDAIPLHNILFQFVIGVHPVTIRTSISVVTIIVGKLASAQPTCACVVVMQGDVGVYLEVMELFINWPPPITLISNYLLRLETTAINQVTDTVWHNCTLVSRSRGWCRGSQ